MGRPLTTLLTRDGIRGQHAGLSFDLQPLCSANLLVARCTGLTLRPHDHAVYIKETGLPADLLRLVHPKLHPAISHLQLPLFTKIVSFIVEKFHIHFHQSPHPTQTLLSKHVVHPCPRPLPPRLRSRSTGLVPAWSDDVRRHQLHQRDPVHQLWICCFQHRLRRPQRHCTSSLTPDRRINRQEMLIHHAF